MVLRSQNGFSANDRALIASYTVPGTTLKIALRKGDCGVVLLEYLRRYHLEVESLYNKPQDLWGYAERTIRGSSTTLSNHASGTAVDCRAVRHPLGARGTFTATELRALDNLLAWFGGVLRHGKSYRSRPDEMHCELVGTEAQIRAVADRIRSGSAPPPPPSPTPRSWFDMASIEDLRAVLRDELGKTDIHRELTSRLPNRRGPGGAVIEGGGEDTLFGYAMNTDGFGYRAEQALERIEARLRGEAPATPALSEIPTPELFAELQRRLNGAT